MRGVFTAVNETTERVLSERRMRILRELAARTAESKSVKEACRTFAEVLGDNNRISLSPSCTWSMTTPRVSRWQLLPVSNGRATIRPPILRWMGMTSGP